MTFPGRIYGPEGQSLQPGVLDLTQEALDTYLHKSIVGYEACGWTLEDVGQVWLLDDEATYMAVPLVIRALALAMIADGQEILILARRVEPEVDVRDGLLDAMERFDVDPAGTA